MTTLFGIPNCDSVKRARDWLAEHDVSYTFHDFKKQGVPTEMLPGWIKAVGLADLLKDSPQPRMRALCLSKAVMKPLARTTLAAKVFAPFPLEAALLNLIDR